MKKKSIILATAIVNSAELEKGHISASTKALMVMIYSQQIESTPKGMTGIIYVGCRNNGKMYTATVAA